MGTADDTVDLDAAIAEDDGKPIKVRLFGRKWKLPSSRPAALTLLMARWMREGRSAKDLAGPELMQILELMVPAEILDEWLKLGLTDAGLARVVVEIQRAYSRADPEVPPPSAGETSSQLTTSSPAGG